MSWPDFKELSRAKNDLVFKKYTNKLKSRKRQIKKKRKVYEPGDIHISDDSNDGKKDYLFRQKQPKLDTTSKTNKKKYDSQGEVVIEWSSDEDIPRSSRLRVRPKKLPLALHNEKVERNKVIAPDKFLDCKNSNSNTGTTDEDFCYMIDENSGENLKPSEYDPNKSLPRALTSARKGSFTSNYNASKEGSFQEIVKENQVTAGGSNSPVLRNNFKGIVGNIAKTEPSSASTRLLNPDLDLLVAEIKKQDCFNERKLRVKKGGYLEKMQRALSRAESNRVFWQHERELGLAEPGCDAVVNRVFTSYGRNIVTLYVKREKVDVILFNNKLEKILSEGSKIKVSFEDKSYHILGTDVYLSTNKVCRS